ncbi:MAG TPA: BON domain-containing protein [Roseiarcus sp.]|nr:BON domain-containing protein [Roseiarcus sp.]
MGKTALHFNAKDEFAVNDATGKSELARRDLCAAVVQALKRRAALDWTGVMVVAHDDRMTLIGKVATVGQRQEAERAARSVPGVVAVEDRLEIG